jgi:hypothetical protein
MSKYSARHQQGGNMILNRSLTGALALGVVILSGAAANAQAKGRSLFTWNGTVDREVVITMRGRDVRVFGDRESEGRIRVNEPLPHVPGYLVVSREDGRGDIDVIEQPSPRNGFTARVRVRDPRGGAGRYRLMAEWVAGNGGGWNGRDDNDRNGRGGGYDGRDNGVYDGRGSDGRGNDGRGNDGRGNDGRNDGGWNNGGRIDAGALNWGGYVDDVAEIRIQGRRVDYFARSGAEVRSTRADVLGAGLPRRDMLVTLDRVSGRGRVYVAQQPTARNGFTAIIRVDDPQGGYGGYGFEVRW